MPAAPRLAFVATLAVAAALAAGRASAAAPTDEPVARVAVAVVDTGVDATQPYLSGKLGVAYDVAARAPASSDAGWHGTAIASIVAGASDDPDGPVSYCPSCTVLPVKALDAHGDGSDADIARGVRWAVDHGARVVNLSLEGPTEDAVLVAAIRYAVRKGAVVVAAAGNDGTGRPTFPAADRLVIGVAATDPNDRLYPWSNRGGWVTIAAPGINLAAVPGGGVFPFTGTSSSAAFISAVAGLCLSVAPNLTPALVGRSLVRGAAPVRGATFGRIDVARTVELCRRYAAAP